MQSNFIIDFIYDNFLWIFIIFLIIIILTSSSTVIQLMKKIQVKVMYLRKNDAIWYSAEEGKEDTLKFSDQTVIRNTDPYIMKLGNNMLKIYFVIAGQKVTTDIRSDRGKTYKNIAEIETKLSLLVESGVVKQGILALMQGLKVPLLQILSYMAVGGLIVMLIMTFTGG